MLCASVAPACGEWKDAPTDADAASDGAASDGASDGPASDGNPGDGAAGDASPGDALADTNVCPMPVNTATVDLSALSCADLEIRYGQALAEAKTCGCDLDCSVTVCDSLCCNCESFVNPGAAAYPALLAAKAESQVKGCHSACPAPTCLLPTSATCGGVGRASCVATL